MQKILGYSSEAMRTVSKLCISKRSNVATIKCTKLCCCCFISKQLNLYAIISDNFKVWSGVKNYFFFLKLLKDEK